MQITESVMRRPASAARWILAGVLTACADYGSDGQEEANEGVEIAHLDQPIRLGVEGGNAGAVEIDKGNNGCTGFLVGDSMVITASHCFDAQLGSATSGTVRIGINYAITGTRWTCITAEWPVGEGKCQGWRNMRVFRDMGPRPDWDIAIVVLPPGQTWFQLDARPRAEGFYTGYLAAGQWYTLYGRGDYHFDDWGEGVMRYMSDQVDGAHAQRIDTTAEATRTCNGDSGGPLYLFGTRWAFAVHSGANRETGTCTTSGWTQQASRINADKRWLINQWRSMASLSTCYQVSPEYWKCP